MKGRGLFDGQRFVQSAKLREPIGASSPGGADLSRCIFDLGIARCRVERRFTREMI